MSSRPAEDKLKNDSLFTEDMLEGLAEFNRLDKDYVPTGRSPAPKFKPTRKRTTRERKVSISAKKNKTPNLDQRSKS